MLEAHGSPALLCASGTVTFVYPIFPKSGRIVRVGHEKPGFRDLKTQTKSK